MSALQAAALIAARAAKMKNVLAVFGTPVTYTRATGGSLAITGAISERRNQEGLTPGATCDLFCDSAAFGTAAPVRGDRVTIGAAEYRVEDVRVDHEGGATLVLRKIT